MKNKQKQKQKNQNIYCPYCGSITILRKAEDIYINKFEDKTRMLYVCKNYPECDSYIRVGANGQPIGTMANKELRRLRLTAHNYFDEIFKNNILTKSDAYKLLSDKLNIPLSDAHIGLFNEYRCKIVIKIAEEILYNHPKTKNKYNNKNKKEKRGDMYDVNP